MAEVERIYNVPLGHVKDIPRTKRAPYAMKQIRDFVVRHMKVDEEDEELYIAPAVNEAVWARGIQKPPSHIRIRVIRYEEEDLVEVSLPEED
ncbi:MAG: 50S ribosomal protein L31e [Thermoplasmata archaeon]|nr:50S ribosomal protein L31e [Thermoplasmata archaeon]NIS11745.1 50S ribosomal protein L31e [Thermoplasmata archaeon]NIS21986.1 50S ribosomal protein L31e [Thermoplasmata archaeon]NIT76813.1 50S ribosomal protein L31e [Thermoplasmata archaeon]NIU51011.1 50S ribosomal protein L31e [Thermoplasmata archaeon]